ncbi:MAG: hypothetical protein JNL58_02330 [Planctomyces sp.]|nr:hypothetical protein [Planctomyces sp.]
MKLNFRKSILTFVVGTIVGAAIFQYWPRETAKAAVAHGNDKFTMVTVPLAAPGEAEAVFVLNHLTGVLRGAALNNSTGTFTHHYLRNVAADFQTAAATPEPKFAIVTASANLRSTGTNQPANGVIYIGELSSGAVIAYSFSLPRGNRPVPGPLEVTKMDFFLFAESVGQ